MFETLSHTSYSSTASGYVLATAYRLTYYKVLMESSFCRTFMSAALDRELQVNYMKTLPEQPLSLHAYNTNSSQYCMYLY